MKFSPLFSPPLVVLSVALVSACSAPSGPDPSASGSAKSSAIEQPAAQPTPINPPAVLAEVADRAAGTEIPPRFSAIGTEPFWSVQVQDGTLTYSTPDMPDGITVPATMRRSGRAVIHAATIDGKPLELEVTRQSCSDGMSDTVYPLAVIRRIGPDIQRGCAR